VKDKHTATEHLTENHMSASENYEVKSGWLGFHRHFVILVLVVEDDSALNHFFQSDPRRLVFGGVNIDPRSRAALQLFAAFGGENNQPVLRVDFLRVSCFGRFFVDCYHKNFVISKSINYRSTTGPKTSSASVLFGRCGRADPDKIGERLFTGRFLSFASRAFGVDN